MVLLAAVTLACLTFAAAASAEFEESLRLVGLQRTRKCPRTPSPGLRSVHAPRTPAEQAAAGSSDASAYPKASLTFGAPSAVNGGDDDDEYQLAWVDFDGAAQPWGAPVAASTLAAGGALKTVNTFRGHAWRITREPEGVVVLEHVADGGTYTVDVPACAGRRLNGAGGDGGAPDQAQLEAVYGHPIPAAWGDAGPGAGADDGGDGDDGDSGDICATDSPALAACSPASYLSDVAAPGMHVLCVLPTAPGAADAVGAAPTAVATVVVFRDGRRRGRCSASFSIPAEVVHGDDGGTAKELVRFLSFKLGLRWPHGGRWRRNPRRLAPALFGRLGHRVASARAALGGARSLFLMEGGQWVWPGVDIGHTVAVGNLRRENETTIIRTVSLVPKIFEVENFLEPSECVGIIDAAAPRLAKSGVAMKDADAKKAATTEEFRTSKTHFLSSERVPDMRAVERRVQALARRKSPPNTPEH